MNAVWTDEKIREGFIDDGGQSAYYDPINGDKEQRRIAGAIFDEWLARHDAEVRAGVDWRVLGGLVPGVIEAGWLRDGDRVQVGSVEGTVRDHKVTTTRLMGRLAEFTVATDTGGTVHQARAYDSEIRVISAADGGGR